MGVGESKKQLSPLVRFLLLSIFLRNVYIDKERQEEAIKESDLDWTIVRPPALTDDEITEEYRVTEPTASAPLRAKISRADVAHFMLNQVEDETWLHKAPSIFYEVD
jgi:putative NADH-flavin reductase